MRKIGTGRTLQLLSALIFMAAALGCSSGSNTSGTALVDTSGNHSVSFMAAHPGIAVSSADQCKSCHGDDLKGGIAKTSCFTAACHHGTIPGFALPASHGATAKKAPGNSGFAACQICHGTSFAGGGSGVSCMNNAACHGSGVNAPHPAKPWHSSTGQNHATVDPGNAKVCSGCHFSGSSANPPNHPSAPAPAGTAPGCFNNTLCHGADTAPHAVGAAWADPTSSAFHGLEAKKNLANCQACHGTSGTTLFDGGAAATKCSTCHTTAKAHPTTWYQAPVTTFPGYVPSHRDSLNQASTCNICHDYTLGRTAPDNTAPSCYSASRANSEHASVGCHANGPGQASHSIPFLNTSHTAVAQAGFDSTCSGCHAVTGTSPLSQAPLCTVCHTAGSPLSAGNCTSCHGDPPSGTSFPNAAGRHAKHNALNGITGVCTPCHTGLDSGSQSHYDHANARPGKNALRVSPGDAAFPSTYNAKSGTASFNATAFTCSNMSCHGGQTAPSWQTGTIDAGADAGCRQCHALGTALGAPENNSPYSGLHSLHLGASVNALCTECHDMANGTTGATNHFRFLNTSQMEGPASQTVAPLGVAANYTAQGQTCGTFTCHNTLHSSFSWTGGANHSVPFLNTAHTAVNQAGYDAGCKACHDPGSTVLSAPVCSVCHTAGSPLTVVNCASCHADPPTGTSFPNVAGTHTKHNALSGITGVCTACHDTFDTGSLTHYNHANARSGLNALRVEPGEAKFLSAYNAKSGTASFSATAFTCSNVSCHGGLAAPNWRTGTINVNADAGCRQCHALGTAQGSPENNSPFSGMHSLHLGSSVNALCTECHDMANGTAGATNHFRFLNTTQMEGPAGQTVAPLGVAANYTAQGQTCGTFTCHNRLHDAFSWSGGANHSVPFLGTAHTAVTQTGFNTGCQVCHAVSGTSPLTSAPACNVCHTAGSPLTLVSCSSCHARPPTGTSFPNVAGTHAKHNALAGVAGICAACHTGFDTGSQAHYDHANARPGKNALRVSPGETAFLSTYSAKTGAASFSATALTCSNVSCHGGKVTPNWQTGTLNVNTQCASCHASGTAQYNSYNSGDHSRSDHSSRACTVCHNTTTLAVNHFTTLGTTAMEGPASATIGGGSTNIAAGNYVPSTRSCTPTCHGRETW